MSSDAVRIAKLNHRTETAKALKEISTAVLGNPVIDYIGGLWLLKFAEKHGYPNMDTGVNQAALLGICTAKAVAPLLPELGAGAAPIVTALTKL